MNILKYAALGLCFAALAACGGGGASSAGGSDGSGGSQVITISLAPTNFTESLVQGLSTNLQVSATAQVQPGATLPPTIYVLIVDNKGVIEPDATVDGRGTSYQATLVTNPDLSVGDHKGYIQIEACGDSQCKSVYGSSSFTYDFKVVSATNLKTLTPLAGATDWQPYNGNAQRTAYVPVTLNASAFSSRWLYSEPAYQPLQSQDDFLGAGGYATNFTNTVTTDSADDLLVLADGPWLIALQETDGHEVWSKDVDPHNYGNPVSPAVANGIVYTSQGLYVSGAGFHGAEFSTYDEMTGAAGFASQYSSPGVVGDCWPCGTGLVTVVGGQAYLEPDDQGYGSDIYVYDASTGASLWTSLSSVNSARAYALDGTDVYFVDDGMDGLVALDQPTGTTQFSVAAVSEKVLSLDGAGGALAFAGGGGIADVNLSSQSVTWKTPPVAGIVTANAIGDGRLYVGLLKPDVQASLAAYSATDGHQLWSWSAPASDGVTEVLSLIATKNLLFVGTDQKTYAIDVKTQAIVWSFPLGGGLSMSPSGILYIQGSNDVAAINLD